MARAKKLPHFGKLLRQWRLSAGYPSQQKASKAFDIPQSKLQQYESGEVADPDPKILHTLSDAYRVPKSEFFGKLVDEKYELVPNVLTSIKVGVGTVYSNPDQVFAQIDAKLPQMHQAWFFLMGSEAHKNTEQNLYYKKIKEMIEAEVTLRFWIFDDDLRKEASDSMHAALLSESEGEAFSERQLKEFLRYEDDPEEQPFFAKIFHPFKALNESYFLCDKPKAISKESRESLLCYFTLPGSDLKDNALIEVNWETAFKRFDRIRSFLTQ